MRSGGPGAGRGVDGSPVRTGPDASHLNKADAVLMSQQAPPPGWGQPPGQGGPPPPRKRSTGKVIGFSCLGLIALAVVLVIALTAAGGEDEPDRTPTGPATRATERERPEDESGARGDVRITACAVDSATKWPSAELLITNRSSKASNYIVEVEFVDTSNKRLGEALATSSGVAPEQRSEVTAQGLTQVSTKITCRITDVTRTAS